MKRFCRSLLLVACISGGAGAPAQTPQTPCKENAETQTQFDLNNCARRAFEEADAEMNRVYRLYLKGLGGDDAKARAKVRAAQLAWLKYRDAHCVAEAMINEGGSIYPLVYSGCQASVTAERTRRMKETLAESERLSGAASVEDGGRGVVSKSQ
ncbi:MAG TPA: lysozyme inhibitor LprI family protein [Pyrinomonadaceae bacterium]|jgi:uncharacterized protein YecT (DUF1311 family)|nr:lysozyme inhibitor LprI family protein [Pyrinomonadaceae bacterium]